MCDSTRSPTLRYDLVVYLFIQDDYRINWQVIAPGPEPGAIPIQMRIKIPAVSIYCEPFTS